MKDGKERILKIGRRYKHFKNHFYRTIGMYDSSLIDRLNFDINNYRKYAVDVINSINDEPVTVYVTKWELENTIPYQIIIFDKNGNILQGKHVFYMALYDCPCGTTFIREYDDFMSLVDKEKYPNCTQKYRFEYSDV